MTPQTDISTAGGAGERPYVWTVEAGDVAALAELQAACFSHDPSGAWGADYLGKLLTQRAFEAWLIAPLKASDAPENPRPVGFLLMQHAGDVGDIASIGILDAWRRRGLGEHLVVVAAAAARATGADRLLLEVAEDNDAARRFYESLGFDCVRVRRGYYERADGQRINALVLQRPLSFTEIS